MTNKAQHRAIKLCVQDIFWRMSPDEVEGILIPALKRGIKKRTGREGLI